MVVLFLVVVIDLIGFGIIIPLLPFFAEHYQASPFQVGLLMAVYSLTQFVAAPFWGRLSDRIGRRPVLLFSLAGAILAYLWLGVAEELWALFAARAVGGFMAGNISAAFAYVADITTRETRAKGMGMIGAAFALGFTIGPAIGGILAGSDPHNADFQSPAFAAAGLSAFALILGIFTLKESLSDEIKKRIAEKPKEIQSKQFQIALKKPNIRLLLLLSFLAVFAFAGIEATFALWSRRQYGWGPEQNGYLFALIGFSGALLQGGLIGRMSKRFGEANLIVQGSIALTLGIGLIPFATELWMLIIVMLIAVYGFSVISPSLNSLISLETNEEDQGGMMGVARSATTLARVGGPAWAGTLFSVLGMNWPYFGGACIMAVVIVISLRILPRLKSIDGKNR
ncbi:MAG: MFS transporter [Rhodospirillales bacterium]|jgi:DHA1 family tetracycline resistance protein-like MFS transporter|tara:strand:- start:502 stop:1692 length:1191 start_codon:yes stop_codon:yes gene_type:complete